MKKIIVSLSIFSMVTSALIAQTTVSGSIRRGSNANTVEIVAKPSDNISAQVGDINIAFSIPDQTTTGGNPTQAQITATSPLNNVAFTWAGNADGSPYVMAGRAYYSYLLLPSSTTDVASALTANTDNLVASFAFASPYNTGIRLEDLTSSGGGPNAQMTWYVQFNQGIGDVTNYTTPFYGYYNAADATNNGGTADQFVTLVVKFLNFSVVKQGNNAALISWDVENEGPNTAYYEIQTSLNGVEFSLLQKVDPLNNGRTSNSYSVTENDLSSIRTSGVIYFRIRQIDRDGKFVYTPIRSIRMNSNGLLVSTYPNPVKSNANVIVDLPQTTEIMVKLVDASGKVVYTSQTHGIKGANFSNINMSKLAAGAYTLNVQAGNEMKTIAVVKAEQ